MKSAHLVYVKLAFTTLVVTSIFSSCAKSSSTDNTASITGAWKGTVLNTNESSSYAVSFTLTQSGTGVTGEFSTAAAGGNVAGSISANSVLLKLTPAASSGYTEVDTLKGVISPGATEISGIFNSNTAGESGTFDITKQ